MITILSWNIQNGLGVDGTRSLERIAQVIGEYGTPDIICLQEVSRGVVLDIGIEPPDQVDEVSKLFTGHSAFFGPAYDVLGPAGTHRAQYGNLVLSRLPILSAFNHPLPQPPRAGKRQMPRQAIEVNVMCQDGPLRIMTSHLEFHSASQRQAQIAAIKRIHTEITTLATNPPTPSVNGPYQAICRAGRTVICGDLNCSPESNELATLTGVSATPSSGLIDSWNALHPDEPHQSTCGIFDHAQWPQGPHCRDYFVISEELVGLLDSIETNSLTNASDHQPISLTLRTDPM